MCDFHGDGEQKQQAVLQAPGAMEAEQRESGRADSGKAVEEETRELVVEARAMSDLLERLQESLARAADKNDSLLEAVEATEARASRESQAADGEVCVCVYVCVCVREREREMLPAGFYVEKSAGQTRSLAHTQLQRKKRAIFSDWYANRASVCVWREN